MPEIEKIKLDETHVGRKVIYKRDIYSHRKAESGVITSFNDTFVFVRYGSGTTSHATSPSALTWDK